MASDRDPYPSLPRRRALALGALTATSVLAGCLSDDNPSDDDDDTRGNGDDGGNGGGSGGDGGNGDDTSAPTAHIEELVTENRRFALDLYADLVAAEPDENLFCSPHSISLALAMTYAGARGETEEQMAETLRYTLGEDVHEAIEGLTVELEARSETDADEDGDPFELVVENTVWGQEGYPFEEDYLDHLEDHYGAGLQALDFQSEPEAARETINEWVEAQTEERIDELLPEGAIDAYVRLVLTNAIYFQASWERPFDEAATESAECTALDGSTADVALMRQSASFPYAEVDGTQVIELPYVGEDVGMVVVLPEDGAFETVEADLDLETFDSLLADLDTREGEIRLPRFEFDSEFSLEDVLSAMGMPVAFDETDADFSGMADLEETGESLSIHDVYHDAYVGVDEDGTEAAAATGVVVGTESAPIDPFEMVVDRPFVFAIRDRPTNTLLFVGRVVDAGSVQ